MIEKYENKEIKINKAVGGYNVGDIVKVAVDKAGTPIKRYWRDRFKDANIDNCVEVVSGKDIPKTKI
jgi:hypothetical protein